MTRRKIAAANWKMNTTIPEGIELFNSLCTRSLAQDVDVVICAPSTHLYALSQLPGSDNIFLGAQNMYHQPKGAFTGELSAAMIISAGTRYVVIGHSERRAYFFESEELLESKIQAALANNLTPIFCCGEALEIRQAGNHIDHVVKQLKASFTKLVASDLRKIVIAYEPIWAIGTGETASPEQAQEMHLEIRNYLRKTYSADVADIIPILYGGSVKPANAKEIFGKPDVDGGLVGGASLDAESFSVIINSFT